MSERWLVLDDTQERHDGFSRMAGRGNIVIDHAFTATQAICFLREELQYDLCFLDHDLEEFPGYVDETGMEVAQFIALHAEGDRVPKLVVIHSHNAPARERMVQVLTDAGVKTVGKPYRAPDSV